MDTGIEIKDTTNWHWIINHDCPEEKLEILKEEHEKDFHGCIGKYLFFSKDKEELKELGGVILAENDLHHGKVSTSLRDGYTTYVLCVYDAGPNLLDEMKKYIAETVTYRYWKSDEDTMKGL